MLCGDTENAKIQFELSKIENKIYEVKDTVA